MINPKNTSKTLSPDSKFEIVSEFNYGYRNREDKTNLKPGILIDGSQNVLTDVSGRVGITKGYTLDGQADSGEGGASNAPILAAYDYEMHTGDTRHLRAGFLTGVTTYGEELVTNGSFTGSAAGWTLGTNWAYGTNNVLHTPGATDTVNQFITAESGGYEVRFTLGGTIGNVTVDILNGGSPLNPQTFPAGSGGIIFHTFIFNDIPNLTFTPSSDFDGTIDNVSVRQFLTGGNGMLQYRYVWGVNDVGRNVGQVEWITLMDQLTSTNINFTDYWDNSAFQSRLLFVNGLPQIYEWSGGVTTVASVTSNTITKQGEESWAEEGFYTSGTRKITIFGYEFTYTGGEGTTTLTGVTPDPTVFPVIPPTALVHQTPRTTSNSAMEGLPDTLANSLISNLKNQIYIGSLVNNQVYVSKVNDYKDYEFTTPVRVVGEGAILTLDGAAVAFIPQEDAMYISAGKDQWYETQFQLSADLASESLTIQRLKTSSQQATQSQALTSKIRNNIVFISNEPVISSFGRITDVVLTPQVSDLSFSIINDMVDYDFTDGAVFYWRNYILVAIPKSAVVRIYNMTNPENVSASDVSNPNYYWEAPLTIPISRFSVIDGELYGHSYYVSESYKLFEGYNFNGSPIDAKAVFSYMNSGRRDDTKSQDEFFVEGYITSNATLNTNFNYELNGYAGQTTYALEGTDTQVIQIQNSDSSLGKQSLGKNPLGGDIDLFSTLPPKFRVIWTFPRIPYYEFSPSFTSSGVDYNWSILAFGAQATSTTEGNNPIKK